MEEEQTIYGAPPTTTDPDTGEQVPAGPHASIGVGEGSVDANIGLVNGEVAPGVDVEAVQANAHFSENCATGEANVASVQAEPGAIAPGVGGGVEALGASGSVCLGEDQSSIGAQANLISGNVAVGNEEHSAQVGASVGVGLGGRVHHSDADNDGVGEYGIGAEIGPVSVDVKSEALGHAANTAGDVVSNVLSW